MFYYKTIDGSPIASSDHVDAPLWIEITEDEYNKLISQKTDTERIQDLETDNNLLKQQLKAASDQNEFLEDCIAEMAEIVYA